VGFCGEKWRVFYGESTVAIDDKGRVHPTEYYLRRVDPLLRKPRLVA